MVGNIAANEFRRATLGGRSQLCLSKSRQSRVSLKPMPCQLVCYVATCQVRIFGESTHSRSREGLLGSVERWNSFRVKGRYKTAHDLCWEVYQWS